MNMHMHINIEKVDGPEAQPPVTGSLWNPPLGRMPIGLDGKKRCDASPNNSRDHNPPHKTKQCVSTRSPLSARHGRPTSKRRIWHASRTKRSVSNIIGSPSNGNRRWDGGHRFIPLDHPHPGRMPVRLEDKKNTRCVPQDSRASTQSLANHRWLSPPAFSPHGIRCSSSSTRSTSMTHG